MLVLFVNECWSFALSQFFIFIFLKFVVSQLRRIANCLFDNDILDFQGIKLENVIISCQKIGKNRIFNWKYAIC
jgi:hypothetical protein